VLNPEDEGTTTLQNAKEHSPTDTASHPRRLQSSAALLSEPQNYYDRFGLDKVECQEETDCPAVNLFASSAGRLLTLTFSHTGPLAKAHLEPFPDCVHSVIFLVITFFV